MASTVNSDPQRAPQKEENDDAMAPPPPSVSQSSLTTVHPDAEEIIRQVDYYFSDKNLRTDAHLLGLIEEGNGSVSLDEILGWKRMRRFNPKAAVREAIKLSQVVEVVDDERLERKQPLSGPVDVKPQINRRNPTQPAAVPKDQPWMTKNMLKPTGLEEYATNGPIKPEEYAQDREAYDPENTFPHRIETAIMRFCSRRKMHQYPRMIWDKFLKFGGINSGQRQFAGGLDDSSMEGYTKREIAEMTLNYEVAEMVVDGLYEDGQEGKKTVTWVVDFDGLARAFLSSNFAAYWDWYNLDRITMASNLLRSFYNYLLYHDVCPEYKDQLLAARKTCDVADYEFPRLKKCDSQWPGCFNIACSTLFDGQWANLYTDIENWIRPEDKIGISRQEARIIFSTAVAAFGTPKQWNAVRKAGNAVQSAFTVVNSEKTGLEVVEVQPAKGDAKAMYADPRIVNDVVRPMGIVKFKRWDPPQAAPQDLPEHFKYESRRQEYEFPMEESMLEFFFPGMKMEVEIKELDIGIHWLEAVTATFPSFHLWLPNEGIRDYNKPGPMLAYMGQDNIETEEIWAKAKAKVRCSGDGNHE